MTTEEIEKNLQIFDKKTFQIEEKRLFPLGRLKDLLKAPSEDFNFISNNHLENLRNPAKAIRHYGGELVMDCNGKVYLFDLIDTMPTDIQLNISSRDKQTSPFVSSLNKIISTDALVKKSKQPDFFLKFKNMIRRLFKF